MKKFETAKVIYGANTAELPIMHTASGLMIGLERKVRTGVNSFFDDVLLMAYVGPVMLPEEPIVSDFERIMAANFPDGFDEEPTPLPSSNLAYQPDRLVKTMASLTHGSRHGVKPVDVLRNEKFVIAPATSLDRNDSRAPEIDLDYAVAFHGGALVTAMLAEDLVALPPRRSERLEFAYRITDIGGFLAKHTLEV